MNEYRVRYVFGTHSVVVAVEGADDWDARRRGDIVLYDTFKVDAITAGETIVEFVRGNENADAQANESGFYAPIYDICDACTEITDVYYNKETDNYHCEDCY